MRTFAEQKIDFRNSSQKDWHKAREVSSLQIADQINNSDNHTMLQRKANCACGGGCPSCQTQSILPVSQTKDASEIEADRIAEKVMRATDFQPPAKPLSESIAPPVQTKSDGSGNSIDSKLSNKITSSQGGGNSLDDGAKMFMESRFGADFSRVKIHTDSNAVQMNRELNAKAFTFGNDIYFNQEQYKPSSANGRYLLAHELTHVLQQNKLIGRKMIQRAETDTSVGCAALTDTKSDVNTYVNTELAALRPASAAAMTSGIASSIGSNMVSSPGRSVIEGWAAGLLAPKAYQPVPSVTKYSGVNYRLWSNPIFPILNPTMKVNGICIGSDKLGHFFQQGHEYYVESHRSGGSVSTAVAGGQGQEAGGYGLVTTGVYSNADLEANRKGLDFYNDLSADPNMTFDIANYINSNWDEVNNPNYYESSVGPIVWRNLLTGTWSGVFEDPVAAVSKPITASLTVGPRSNTTITGTFSHSGGSGTLTGTITHNTTAPAGASAGTTAITGVTIGYDWISGINSGKGTWSNVRENELHGTYGFGTSNSNGGRWDMSK